MCRKITNIKYVYCMKSSKHKNGKLINVKVFQVMPM